MRLTTAAAALLVATSLSGCFSGQSADTNMQTLTGTATYRERMALPQDAVLEVKLVDVSRMDAPSTTISEYSATISGVPATWEITYDPALIQSGNRYALQARITSGDQLFFTTTSHNAILTGADDSTDLVLQRAGN